MSDPTVTIENGYITTEVDAFRVGSQVPPPDGTYRLTQEPSLWVDCPISRCHDGWRLSVGGIGYERCDECGGSGRVLNPELVERVAVELDGSREERLDAARRVLEAIGGTP